MESKTTGTGFWSEFLSQTLGKFHSFMPRLIYAVIFLVVGIFLIRLIMALMRRIMEKAKTELSIRSFVESMSVAILYAFLAFVVGRTLGVKATNFLAIFTGATVTIGLALQGSLANFAGGLLILLFKPFKIGDEVEIGNVQGEVTDINILYTKVHNWRGEYFTLPNGKVANETVKNNSADEYRRVQIELHFALDEDVDRLRDIIIKAMKSNPKAEQHRPFQFWVGSFENYYLKTSARCWSKTEDYWGVYWSQIETIKKALAANGIKLQIPKQVLDSEPFDLIKKEEQ